MKSITMLKQTFSPLNVSFLILTAALLISANAKAEYYLVYPAGYAGCYQCWQPCVQPCYPVVYYFRSVSPERHTHRGEFEMSEYIWIDP